MAAGRSLKSLVGRRRRADEEGEDEEGPVVVEDSQSEGSILSDLEDDDADGSSVDAPGSGAVDRDPSQGKVEGANGKGKTVGKKSRKSRKKASKKQTRESGQEPTQAQNAGFKAMADTAAMMNGLKIEDQAHDAVDFEDMHLNGSATPSAVSHPVANTNGNTHTDAGNERDKKEQDEARKKRDANPAFVPVRGNFFMHDTRTHNGPGSPPVRGAWSGRGRGRGAANVGGPFSPANQLAQAERAAEQPWKHDLHESINEEAHTTGTQRTSELTQNTGDPARVVTKPGTSGQNNGQRVLSFSTTTKVGTVQIRVFLAGMSEPITFSEVPWKQYTRLPDHRPPLRRDKPVRISLPGHVQRYIFPSPDRSFIFIPRQMRPNQQGFGRYAYQRSIGGYGYSSRRTSMYGGSMYAASVAASRRSSFASVARESAFSPVTGGSQASRPVVRLPHGQHHHHYSSSSTPMGPLSGHQTPTGLQVHTFPLPQQPMHQGTPSAMVHQPRPQKAISVAGIESPAMLQHAPLTQEAQPFQNQLPAHLHEQSTFMQSQPYQSPNETYAHPPQPQTGTPLSGIPEQAVHASAFQPPNMSYGQIPYYPPYPQQGYYYPHAPNGYQPMPMYMPPPQGYMMSPPAPALASQPPVPPTQSSSQPSEAEQQRQHQSQSSQSQSGMVAHESNGMVYYLPASEASQQPHGETYQPAESFVPSYAMPGLPPPTPAPETAYYYPSQMAVGGMPPAMYYPPQTQQQ